MNAIALPPQVANDQAAAAMPADADAAYDLANAYVIDCPEMFEAAADELKDLTRKIKEANDKRMDLTRPLDAAKKTLMEFFNGPISRWEAAATLIRSRMLAFQQAEQKKIDDARREAEAKQAREQALLEQQQREALAAAQAAQATGDHVAEATALVAVADARDAIELAEVSASAVLATTITKAKGISTRKNWTAEITDFNALVLHAADEFRKGNAFPMTLIIPDEKALNTMAKAMQGKLSLPGVRAKVSEGLAVRTK